MNWNPVEHVRHSWYEMTSAWGKATVVIFYVFVWLFILANVYQSIAPLSQGYDCVTDTADALSAVFLAMALRGWCVALVFWALYVENAGLNMPNLSTFTVMMLLGCGSFFVVKPKLNDIGEGDNECYGSIVNSTPFYVVPLLVAILTLYLEKRSIRGTTAESQALMK